ncbi:MAG: alpha-hydroxy acid oxidase [Gemmatimonadota bacterium]
MSDDATSPSSRRELLRSAAGALAVSAFATGVEAQPETPDQQQARAASARRGGPPAEPLVNLADFERAARSRISHMAYEYIAGGAGDGRTLAWNEEAYGRLKLRSRVLVDVSRVDTTVRLLGRELPFPIILAPTAYHKLVHREGESATARGAGAAGAAMILSSFSTVAVEEVSRAATAPLWFQLYTQADREFTRALVQRAEAAGCQALCVTVDTPVLGARDRETRTGFTLPPGLTRAHLANLTIPDTSASHRPREGQIYSAILDPTLTWREIEWLRGFARVPILLKGILDTDDARVAADSGVAGIIVSNHGARNLDTVPASAEALPRVAEAVAGRMPILVDGGIRRGTDVLKALALGASAVCIGRPYLYGLSVDGARGITRIIEILRTEFEMAMALTGRTSVADINREVLWS